MKSFYVLNKIEDGNIWLIGYNILIEEFNMELWTFCTKNAVISSVKTEKTIYEFDS